MVEYPPWSWPSIRKRLEELERRMTELEGGEVKAVADEPEDHPNAQRKPRRK